jgi:hypothetical protein
MTLVLTYDMTGAIILSVQYVFVMLASMPLICCLRGQKDEFVRIMLMPSFTANKTCSVYYSFLYYYKAQGGPPEGS